MSHISDTDERARWAELHDGVHLSWAEPSAPPVTMACRNCATDGPKPVLLEAHVTLWEQGTLHTRLLQCPTCGCAFAQDAPSFDYELNAANEISVAFYVEVGAGLWPIVRCLARLDAPPNSRYLEIGCGFGFGLDFALRERGWTGHGIDPSPIAVAARHKLGLAIENRYFRNDEAAGTDAAVILASEVVEHMSDPLAFVQTLKAALRTDGVLVLTTPDRAQLRPDAPLAQLVPILSVGAHIVLETVDSLALLLRRAGFANVEVVRNSAQLVAYASDAPLRLETDEQVLRRDYRTYLERRTGVTPSQDYVWWGFSGRAYQEAVVDADWAVADRIWVELSEACRAQFGFKLDESGERPDTRGLRLWELAAVVPKALPSLLYARALQRNQTGATMAALEGLFRAVVDAAVRLNDALRADASEDQATLGVERDARIALATIAANAGRADAPALLRDAAAADPARTVEIARRCFVGLVNAGRNDLARELLTMWDLGIPVLDRLPPGRAMSPVERDTLFCLAVMGLDDGTSPFAAIRRFARVREGVPHGELWWSALRGECVAADRLGIHAHADTLLSAAPLDGMPSDLRARRPTRPA